MSTPEQHQRISELFAASCDLKGEALEHWWATISEEDPEVLAGLRELLAHDGEAFEELDQVAIAQETLDEQPALPGRIGPFHITERLGAGGMGVVYAARQDSLDRDVALKVVRRHLGDASSVARFLEEARTLARLDHPGIARVHDAGSDEDGLPWIAMERIVGRDLRTHVAEADLDRAAILELFALVCDAVEHAHQRGVVHRDLKPSNVLVDADGRPHVLDFGIARLDDSSGRDQTETGRVLGTIGYMSPEQAAGDRAAVGPPADVHALGVMLHEALVGVRPLSVDDLPLAQALRTIQTRVPPALSSHDSSLKGDLDVIVGKALDKDPAQRFPTASGLGAELRRHLRGDTILSRPPSLARQIGSLRRRHRAVFHAGLVALIAIVVGATLAVTFGLREADARQRADRATEQAREEARVAREESSTTRSLLRFLTLTLGQADPLRTEGEEPTLAEALERVSGNLAQLDEQPAVQARVRGFLGVLMGGLGRYQEGLAHLEVAMAAIARTGQSSAWMLDVFRATAFQQLRLGRLEDVRKTLDATDAFLARFDVDNPLAGAEFAALRGELLANQGAFEEARTRLEAVLEALPETSDESLELTARVHQLLGKIAMRDRDVDRTRDHFARTLAIRRQLDGDRSLPVSETLEALAEVDYATGAIEKALQGMKEAIAIREAQLAPDHPALLTGRANLAAIMMASGKFEAALPIIARSIESLEAVNGPDHPELAGIHARRAMCLERLGREEEADTSYERAITLFRPLADTNKRSWFATQLNHAVFLYETERLERAVTRAVEALAEGDRLGEATDADRRMLLRAQVGSLLQLARAEEAREACERYVALFPLDSPDRRMQEGRMQAIGWRALIAHSGGRLTDALTANSEVMALARSLAPSSHRALRAYVERHIRWLEEAGRKDETAPFRAELEALDG